MYVFYELLCQTEKVFMSVLIQIKGKVLTFLKHKQFIIFWLVPKLKYFEHLRYSVIGGNTKLEQPSEHETFISFYIQIYIHQNNCIII